MQIPPDRAHYPNRRLPSGIEYLRQVAQAKQFGERTPADQVAENYGYKPKDGGPGTAGSPAKKPKGPKKPKDPNLNPNMAVPFGRR